MNRGLLLTMTEPPPAMEEEFNAWYDDEHMQSPKTGTNSTSSGIDGNHVSSSRIAIPAAVPTKVTVTVRR